MNRYVLTKLQDIGKVITGKTPQTSKVEFYDGDYLFISPLELHNAYNITSSVKTLTELGMKSIANNTIDGVSVLVGCIGWDMGNIGLCHEYCATNQQINSITKFKEEICNPYYVYYWLLTKKSYLFSLASITRTPILSKSVFENIEIPLPQKREQDKIVSLLKSVDDKIELNKKIISELESMAKTLYDYWFLQFDFPDENGKPYKSSGGKMVYNEELKREIPEGWEVKELGKLFSITMGSSPKGECLNENGEGIEFYQGSTDFGSLFPTERVYTLGPIRIADKNDILLSVRAPVGDMNIAMNRCCIGRGLAAVHCDSSLFALNTLKTLDKYFKVFNTSGTTFGALTSDGLKGQLVIAAPQKLVDKYKEIVDSAEKKIRKSEKENRDLASLRDFLLPMLMNGQVTFKDAAEAHNN